MAAAPDASDLSDASRSLHETLKKYCSLAWPILKTQCALAGIAPRALTEADLPIVVPRIAGALARFTSPDKAQRFQSEMLGPGSPERFVRTRPRPDPHGGAVRRSVRPSRTPPSERGEGLAGDVLTILLEASPLAQPIFESQCQRAGVDPTRLEPHQLEALLEPLEKALARFGSARRAAEALAALRRLLARSTLDPAASG